MLVCTLFKSVLYDYVYRADSSMEIENTVFPLSRYWYSGSFRTYYAYGNTPAKDFLQNCSREKEPTVLVLGCGDIRSCFYSLWKNFDVKGPARFDGVHFVLNDVSAGILARNVLLLYLCLTLPKEESELKKCLSGMWAIWYCHELYPEHDKLLSDALLDLCKYAKEWASKDNPLYPMVKFSSPSTLKEVQKTWKMWHAKSAKVPASVEHMLLSAQQYQATPILNANVAVFVEHSTEIPFEGRGNSKKSDAQKSDVLHYLQRGSIYAERVLGLQLSSSSTLVNHTFFEKEDGMYCLHYQSLPFRCYYHTVDFSSEQLQHLTTAVPIHVDATCFKSSPMLANSVQQFTLWLQSSNAVLVEQKHKISFTFDCSHALTFCHDLEYGGESQKFDLIYTSNLMDHLGPPNLVLSAIPLLKDSALLFTSTLLKVHFGNLDQYLFDTFGFESKYLPALLGVRCINHEGGSYSSPVTVQPCPLLSQSSDFVLEENLLIWDKVNGNTLPLVFPPGQQLPAVIKKALLNTVRVCAFSQLETPPRGYLMMRHLCLETPIKVIQVFMSNTCADFSPHFWQPLSSAMQEAIKPFLSSMQTQLLLHGIHMHLTVAEKDCPICLKSLPSDHVGLFTTSLELSKVMTMASPRFMAFVHKKGFNDAEHLYASARSGGEVHIFDCISPSAGSNTFIQLYFYAPLILVQKGYQVTIVHSIESNYRNHSNKTLPLKSLKSSFCSFKFFQADVSEFIFELPSFGTVTSHSSNGDGSDVEICLHPSALSALEANKLQPKRVSSSVLELRVGESACQLKYPYLVAYDSIQIKLRRKEKKIQVHCPRAFYDFCEEKPFFAVNPDKILHHSTSYLTKGAVRSLLGQQYTRRDCETIHETSSLLMVKGSFFRFFLKDCHFYHLVNPNGDTVGFVHVINRLFDCENRVPVVDLVFCFPEESLVSIVSPKWERASASQPICSIQMSEKDYDVFKAVFHYFSRRTQGTCSSINKLREEGIQEYFTRAVISPLLCDAVQYSKVISDQLQATLSANETTKCDNCSKCFEDVSKCANCKKASYCSRKCQCEHWKTHKILCEKPKSQCPLSSGEDVLEDKEAIFQPFPVARYWYDGDFRYYYAYGNTAAEDFLQNCTNVKEPKILSLGCGDIRSCFYTLWRNFDSSQPKALQRFDGVHFVLNDCSSAVLARNILFLYLCIQLPHQLESRKKWLCAMWAIWYCHELHSQHQEILDDSLRVLLRYSNSLDLWACSENPLGRLVMFASPASLADISQTWKTWLERKIAVNSVEQMHLSRCMELKRRGVVESMEIYAFSFSQHAVFICGEDYDIEVRKQEVIGYINKGFCYAENVLNMKMRSFSTSVNLTLYEREDGVYSLHHGSMPFSGYHHTVEFSPDALKLAGVKGNVCDSLLVPSQSFAALPFLSNSVQQFSIWIQSASEILTRGNNSISFTFDNSHALSFCQELQLKSCTDVSASQFDLIYSSNLMDHLGPPNVVLSAVMLLKASGLLFTTTLLYKNFSATVEEYIASCFGFDCKLLPMILGIRCINHEGADYTSSVMSEHLPVDLGNMLKTRQHDRTLIWEKVSAQPFVLPQLPHLEAGNVTDGLFDILKMSAFSLLANYCKSSIGRSVLNNSCIETAMLMFKTFIAFVSGDISDNYKFWEPLSRALRQKAKPFLNCLQTQSLLHKLHIHLTVNEEDCPMCLQREVEEHVGTFCADVPLPIHYMTPHFFIFVHQYSSSDAQYLCNEAMSGKDVHIFDCIDGNVVDKTLKLRFFVPLKFVEDDYKVTVALSYMHPQKNIVTPCLPTTNIRDKQINFVKYSFLQLTPGPKSKSNSFGELSSHIGDGNKLLSEIILSDSALEFLMHHKLDMKKLSCNEVQLLCGALHFNLEFHYPVDYDGINVKLSKTNRNIKIIAPRTSHLFTDEKPIAIATPDHQLSLPPQDVKNEVMVSHSGMQRSVEEKKVSDKCNRDHSLMTPLMNLKETFKFFFQYKHESYFHLMSPNNILRGLVVVNQCLLDYQCRAPAIDLAFCFCDYSNELAIGRAWMIISRGLQIRSIYVDDAEYVILAKALAYFAKRTNGNCQSAPKPSKYQVLHQQKVDHLFTRAVIYLLYSDSDHIGLDMVSSVKDSKSNLAQMFQDPILVPPTGNPSIDEKCDYCEKYFPTTKKCTRCGVARYCSKDCQAKHWPSHSKDCKTSKASTSTDTLVNSSSKTAKPNPKCSFCANCSATLKKCKQCGKTQYCGKECQAKDWPQHKIECDKAKSGAERAQSGVKKLSSQAKPCNFTCAYCNASSTKLMSCTRCGKAKYCGKDCQRMDWKNHKKVCN